MRCQKPLPMACVLLAIHYVTLAVCNFESGCYSQRQRQRQRTNKMTTIMRKTKRKGDTKRDTTKQRNMSSKDGAEEQKYTKMHSATQGVAIQASGPLCSDRLRAHEGGPRAVVKTYVFALLFVIFLRHALSRDLTSPPLRKTCILGGS